MKNSLKNHLKIIYGDIPLPFDHKNMDDTIFKARQIMTALVHADNNISFWEFFWRQLRFIKKEVWTIQFGTILFCGFLLFCSPGKKDVIGQITALLPLCFIAGTGELSKAFVNQTAEMEMAARFTLQQVLLSRITLLGLADLLLLSFISILTTCYLEISLIYAFMYFCVPFLITSFTCLFILNHVRTKECNYYCAAVGMVIMMISFYASQKIPALYTSSLIGAWYLLFAAALSGVLIECMAFVKNCKKICCKYLLPKEVTLWNLH